MKMVQYRVRYADPSEVHSEVVRVWNDNLPVDGHAEAKFTWTYGDALERPQGVFVLAADSGAGGERIVGTAGLGVRTFYRRGRRLRGGLLADLAVDRDHRTALPAIRLVRQARRTALRDFDFAYGYPNEQAEGVFVRCGYRRLGTLARYARVLRHEPYVRRMVDAPLLPRLAGAALDIGHALAHGSLWMRSVRGWELSWVEDVDERFDELWERARREYELIGKRDAAFLRWRFLRHPEHSFRIARVSERGVSRGMAAYAVIERVGDAAHVRDLFGHKTALGPILDLLAMDLARRGCTSMSMSYLGSRDVVDILVRHGYKRRESTRAIVFDTGEALADLSSRLDDPDCWHLTDADEDT